MTTSIKTYTPSDITLIVGQTFRVQGLVSVGITFPTERYEMIRGIKGKNIRVRSLDTSCVLSVEVLQTSITNDVLSSIVNQDSMLGTGRMQVLLQDLSGTTQIQSDNAYILSLPTANFGKELHTRTWEIVMLDTIVSTVGGNVKQRPKFIEDAMKFIGL